MRRAVAALGQLTPRASPSARVQADWIPTSVQNLFESCQRIQSLRSGTKDIRRIVTFRGYGTVPARCQQSMHSMCRTAHQQASASTSASAAAAAAWQHVTSRGISSLRSSAIASVIPMASLTPSQIAALRAAFNKHSFSAASTSALREHSRHGLAAAARAHSNSAAAIVAAARGWGSQIGAAFPTKVAQQSRQLTSTVGASAKVAARGTARNRGLASRRSVLHPTAILAARSSRHFATWGEISRGYQGYEPSSFRVLLRRSLDPQTVLYTLIGACLSIHTSACNSNTMLSTKKSKT